MRRSTRIRLEKIERDLGRLSDEINRLGTHPGSGSYFYGVKIPGWSESLSAACDMIGVLKDAVFVDCSNSACKKCDGATPHKCRAWEVE